MVNLQNMEIALQILAVLVAAGTFLPLIRSDVWVVRGWDFPKIQLFAAGAVLLAALLWTGVSGWWWDGAAVALLSLALTFQLSWMVRYTPLHKVTVPRSVGEPALKVLISNVLMSNRNGEALVELVRRQQPDILIALEVDEWWNGQIARLADDYPHSVELPQDDTYGMVVRSRIPLIEPRVERLVRTNIPSVHADIRIAGDVRVHLHVVHPKPPFPDEDTSSTERDAELLIVARRVEQQSGPAIVLGDLNDVAWSRTTKLFQKTSGMLDPRMGRGFFNTFHAGHWWMRWPLDHVFITPHFQVRRIERLRLDGSDHFSIYVEFCYRPSEKDEQDPPETDAAERERVGEKIAEVR